MSEENTKKTQSFLRLVNIMRQLRAPGGCPWDAEQTPRSLTPYMIEETYEAVHAIEEGTTGEICEELGDMLLQIVFQAQIFEEQGHFSLDEVCDSISDKLVRRHPHVFADTPLETSEQLFTRWDQIKADERRAKGQPTCPLGSVPVHLPALARATKLLQKAAKAKLPFPLSAPSADPCPDANEESLGNQLLKLCHDASQQGLDPERALRRATEAWLRQLPKTPEY